MMEGAITVADNEPQGTVFTLTLPVNDAKDANIEDLPTTDGFLEENDTDSKDALQHKPVMLVAYPGMETGSL